MDKLKMETSDMAAENIEKIVGADTSVSETKVRPSHPESATIKFTDLKFGKNYDPNK